MESTVALSVGVDCGGASHYVCVLDGQGTIVAERVVSHTPDQLVALADWLLTLGEPNPARIGVAIEHPRGPVVELFLERGFVVYAINPKQVDRFRDRYTVGGAKDDRRDAWVLARALQTDAHAFRAVEPDAPAIVQLRTLSRLDTELGAELQRTANRLREQLQRYYPALLTWCPAADEPWLWQVLAVAPTPAAAAACPLATLASILKRARIRRFNADALHATLQTASFRVAPGTIEAASLYVRVLLPQLELLHRQRADTEKQLTQMLRALATESVGDGREHPDVTILLSLPGVGVRIGATMLAEAAHALRTRDYHALRLLAGVAPVTKASGKRRVVIMRQACNLRLRVMCYHWGRIASQTDGAAQRHYRVLRAAGHSHGRAIRGVTDRLLAVLIGMLRAGTLYDRQRRRAA